MELIDTHCHISELTEDKLIDILDNAKANNVSKMICVGASNGIQPNYNSYKLSQEHKNVYCSIGIHPHDAGKSFWDDELLDLASKDKVVAIGETGLDFFKNWSDFTEQEILFRKTIGIAKDLNKPIIIHCRDAHERTLQILKEEKIDQGVFHCFGENFNTAKLILDLGFNISITGILTFKKADALRETVKQIPLDRLMLETDAPYMAPEPFRGKESEPAHVKLIAETLSKIHDVSIQEIAEKTTSAARKLFKI